MQLAPRLLYGLHERFLLFPYVYGSRHTRLVLRATQLGRLLNAGITKAATLWAPLVLGELHSTGIFRTQDMLPQAITGQGIHSFYYLGGAQLYLRHYRAQALYQGRSLRFEAGSKVIFATHTQYFSLELLRELICQRPDEKARKAECLSGGNLPPLPRGDGDHRR